MHFELPVDEGPAPAGPNPADKPSPVKLTYIGPMGDELMNGQF